jgi:hypothetical protein
MAVVDQTGQNIAAAVNIHEGQPANRRVRPSPAADFQADILHDLNLRASTPA